MSSQKKDCKGVKGQGMGIGETSGLGGNKPDSPVRIDVREIAQTVDVNPNESRGKNGKPVELISNHYPLIAINKTDEISGYQYDIEITRRTNDSKSGKPQDVRPNTDNYDNICLINKRIIEKMAAQWIKNGQTVLQPKTYGFDGNKILFSINELNIGSEQITREVDICLNGFDRTYDVMIHFSRRIPIDSINNLVNFDDFTKGHPMLDIGLRDRDLSNQNLVSVGRDLFDLNDNKELRDNNCWTVFGQLKAIHSTQCGLTVDVDWEFTFETASKQSPLKRFEKIQTSINTINESLELMANFGYKIDTNPIKLIARELPAPRFQKRLRYNAPVSLRHTVFINLSDLVKPNITKHFNNFFINMINSAGRLGMTIDMPIIWNNFKPEYDYELSSEDQRIEAFEKFIKTFNEEKGNRDSIFANTEYIFVCIPSSNDIYNTVKYCTENESENISGILTQCIKDEKFLCPPPGYIDNYTRKTNFKINGMNQVLSSGYRPNVFAKSKTMVVGANVTHPQVNHRFRTSIAAVVGSYDTDFTKYYAITSALTPNVEIIRDFNIIIGKLMKQFKGLNKSFPQIIAYFRDGVSDSELETVMSTEVGLIYKAYETLKVGFMPNILAMVVQRRHHTRFILSKPNFNHKTNKKDLFNPRPGTVVDHTITSAKYNEFFLFSNKGYVLGTSRQPKYIVLRNDLNLMADDIQKYAYSMCYTYHRCSTPISMPIPVRYADIAADLAKRHLSVHNMRYLRANPNATEQQWAEQEEDLLRQIDNRIKVNDCLSFLPYYN